MLLLLETILRNGSDLHNHLSTPYAFQNLTSVIGNMFFCGDVIMATLCLHEVLAISVFVSPQKETISHQAHFGPVHMFTLSTLLGIRLHIHLRYHAAFPIIQCQANWTKPVLYGNTTSLSGGDTVRSPGDTIQISFVYIDIWQGTMMKPFRPQEICGTWATNVRYGEKNIQFRLHREWQINRTHIDPIHKQDM